VPIHGGPGDPNGDFDAIYSSFVNGSGFTPVHDGSSYVQAVTWNNSPCPDAATILTYSESSNPRSPFFSDQTKLFSRKVWVPEYFCAAAVRAHTLSTTSIRADGPTRTVRARPQQTR